MRQPSISKYVCRAWAAAPGRILTVMVLLGLILGSLIVPATRAQDASTTDARTFSSTNYRVDRDSFWDYYQARGGVAVFGPPISRDFQFMGCPTQFFQRFVMQDCGQGVTLPNLLDPPFLPYTSIDQNTFPSPDPAIQQATPAPDDPSYAADMAAFVQANAPDTFQGQPVNFYQSFIGTVSPDVLGTDDPSTLTLAALEVWGAPTSQPAADPNNPGLVYLRFERGVMQYNPGCGCTQGLLLGAYLEALLTGQNLPSDLAQEASGSPLLGAATSGGTPPSDTTFGNAFVPLNAAPAVAPAASPASSPIPSTVAPVTSPDYGISMFIWGNPSTTGRDLGLATGAGFHWQKSLFQWRLIEGEGRGIYNWTEADRVVQASAAAGVKTIARLDFEPSWARADGASNGPPDNYQDYWDFVSAFVTRYQTGSPYGTVQAIEIWNEPNLTREWGNQVISPQQAGDYVRLLSGAYSAAKAVDPSVTVITAGLSPTGVTNGQSADDAIYLQWLYDAGMSGNYDVLGAHGNTQAPVVDAPLGSLPNFGDASFYFRRIEQLRATMVSNGDAAKQIWLLEFGWTSDQIHPDYSWYAISEDQKAANIVQAYHYARQNWAPWIGVMTLWTISDPGWTPELEEYWWAVTNPDGTPRAAYNAVRAARLSGDLP